MPERKKLYLRILKAELGDCVDDLAEISHGYTQRFECQEIGGYVNGENQALLYQEIRALEELIKIIDQIDDESYDSVEMLHLALEALVSETISSHAFPPAVVAMVHRRTVKVLDYVKNHPAAL